jgi:ABC-type Fe3+ transport system substrate-binding protein
MEFQKAYPEIAVEYVAVRGADFVPRIVSERQAELYLYDVHVGGAGTPAQELKPQGFLDPLEPELVLPDVVDDKTWLGGYREAYYDKDGTHVFGFQASLWYQVYVNRDAVPESELSRVQDLTLPQWRDKIASDGITTFGAGCGVGAHWLMVLGEESFRQLYTNGVTISRDRRQVAEWAIRGRYPIVLGIAQTDFSPFVKEGLGQNVRPLEPTADAGVRISVGQGTLAVMNRAPNPNARRLFANWLLSREGQAAWARHTLENSRRLDVTDGPAETRGDPNRKYLPDIAREENLHLSNRCVEIGFEIYR